MRLGQGGDPQKQRSSTEQWGRHGRSSCWGSPTNTRAHRLVLDKPRQLVWQARGSQDQELVGQRWEPAELGGLATLLIGGKPRTKNRPSSSQLAITLTYLARLTEWTAKWEEENDHRKQVSNVKLHTNKSQRRCSWLALGEKMQSLKGDEHERRFHPQNLCLLSEPNGRLWSD